jgi:sulfur dioxygenase
MIFRQLFDQETWTYTYLIADENLGEALIVDSVLERCERDIQLISELGLRLKFTLETHVHADHITGAGKLRNRLGCKTVYPFGSGANLIDQEIADKEIIRLGEITIRAISTPGHTDAHMAYLVNSDRVLTGDALFIRGCGRTDFQSGNPGQLYDAIWDKIFSLEDSVMVFPGHDYQGQLMSTIGEEKRFNPRFQGKTRQEFIRFMDALNLPHPKKIKEAVPANLVCGQVEP